MKFRLASVLSLREAQLTESSEQVARIQSRFQEIESSRTAVDAEQHVARAGVALTTTILAADLHIGVEYLKSLERQGDRLRAESYQVRQTLDSARSVLVTRHQAVSTLQRLKERLSAAATLEAAHSEQRALDEVAGVQAYRRKIA